MLKKCKTFICVILLLSIMVSDMAFAVDMADTSVPGDGATLDVKKAYVAGIVYSDLMNNYQQNITRREFCDVAVNLYWSLVYARVCESISFSPYIALFKDIDINDYNIKSAYGLGIVKGYSNNVFAPDDNITREQLAVMLGRVLVLAGCEVESADLTGYEDYDEISDWAKGDLSALVAIGAIKGVSDKKMNPQGLVTREEAFSMAWRVYSYLTNDQKLLYEETTDQILTELGIIDETFFEEEYITTRELLQLLVNIMVITPEDSTDGWERYDWYPLLDKFSDEDKLLILNVFAYGHRGLIAEEDIAGLDMDSKATYYQTLVFLTRMVGDTYSCIDSMEELWYTERNEFYEKAFEKGLITDTNMENADEPITRQDLKEMLHKVLFIRYSVGGIAPYMTRLIDRYIK